MVPSSNLKKYIACLFMIFTSCSLSFAQENIDNDQLEKGIEAFQNQDFEKAISCLSPFEEFINELDEDPKAMLALILGTCYEEIENYPKALLLYEVAKSSSPSNKTILIQILPQLLSIYSNLNDDSAAMSCCNEMISLLNSHDFIETGFYTDYTISLSIYFEKIKNYQLALEIAEKGISVIDNVDLDDRIRGLQKNSLYMALGIANVKLQNYRQAVIDYKNALMYISYAENEDESDALSRIGNCYEYAGMPDSALVYLERAEELYRLKGEELSKSRIINSLELGVVLHQKGQCLRAQEYLLNAEKGIELLQDDEHLAYVYTYLYHNSKDIGNQELVRKYSNLIKQYIKTVKKDNSRISNICYSTYASILDSEGQTQKAIGVMDVVANNEGNDADTPQASKAASYSKQAIFYMKSGDYIQAENAIRSSLKMLNPIKNDFKSQYINNLTVLAEILMKTNRIGEGIKGLENIEYLVKESNDDNITAPYYSMLASLYGEIGNNDKCLEYDLLVRDITLKNKGENSYAYAVSLINLSEDYSVLQQREKGKECLDLASDIIINLYGENSEEYYKVLHKLAFHYSTIEEGKIRYNKCLSLSQKLFGKKSIQHGEDLCWYSTFLMYDMEDKHATDIMQEGLDILNSIEGYDRYTLFFMAQLSVWYHVAKDYEKAYAVDKDYFDKSKKYISDNLPNLIDWQRESLWSPIHEHLNRFILAASETSSSLYLKLAYNSLLLGKGLLLQSANNVTNAIKQSNDIELKIIHEQLQLEKDKFLRIENADDALEIRNNINRLQREELNSLSQSDILRDLFDFDWTDVCESLEEGDVAIEFVSCPTQDCVSYVALVLNSKSREPLCIPLFNDKELKRYMLEGNVEYDYQNPDLYRVIWDRLETYALNDAKNVYFAPDGLLHKMAIECLVDKQGRIASDKWNLHRLTSTREIVRRSSQEDYKSAVLYGGLAYTLVTEDLENRSHKRAAINDDIKDGTMAEVEEIKRNMDHYDINCKIFDDIYGTEDSFKSLSSKGVNILHMATHGFFWTEENEKEYSKVQFKDLLNNSNSKESALLRSGLLLSGADIALTGENALPGIQDGILTAQEISTMDFEGLDLVVLSACQTALGEISGDGVFGLQRGFKLAGAQSLLMSLWKVDDAATRLLMTEFYNQMLRGVSKIDALRSAQKKIRNIKEYEAPEYWAGFILLDGI